MILAQLDKNFAGENAPSLELRNLNVLERTCGIFSAVVFVRASVSRRFDRVVESCLVNFVDYFFPIEDAH